jgi:hypothetical protein
VHNVLQNVQKTQILNDILKFFALQAASFAPEYSPNSKQPLPRRKVGKVGKLGSDSKKVGSDSKEKIESDPSFGG